MSIKQFSGHWMPEKDRLMIRFNTNDDCEYRLWITRHLLKKILQISLDIGCSDYQGYGENTAKLIQQMSLDVLKNETNLKENYEGASKFPIGKIPILVLDINIEATKNFFSVDMQLVTNQKLNIKITKLAWRQFVVLLDKLQKDAGWELLFGELKKIDENTSSNGLQKIFH